jgi:hypothetical protein
MRSLNIAFFMALAIIGGFPLVAHARPVTAADLSGKAICWNDGDKQLYLPGGKFSSTRWGKGTWRVTAHGVQIHSHPGGNALSDIRLKHGTFSLTTLSNLNGQRQTAWGKYCHM